jgi:ATP-dependent Clp protease ATP-binding subunit ClpC
VFERFTDRARTVVVLAQEEARGLGHNYIGTEHLLLGLLAEGHGVGAKVLTSAGVTFDATRAEIVSIVGAKTEEAGAKIPFTPRAKTVLERSLREALKLGHNYIGTEHILLGLLEEGMGVAAQLLVRDGLTLERARGLVLHELGSFGPHASPIALTPWRGGAPVRRRAGQRQNATPAVAEIWVRAQQLAEGDPISSGHLLRALAASTDSQAARVLSALGVSADRVEGAVSATPVEGTTDETPTEAIARIANIRAEQGRVVIELADEQLAEGITADPIEVSGALADALQQFRDQLTHWLRDQASDEPDPGGPTAEE